MRLPRVEDIEKRIPRPEDFTARSRGPATTARVGTALGIAFGICFLTGLWSHSQYTSPGWLPIGPDPVLALPGHTGHARRRPASPPIPLLLVKLWSVYPRVLHSSAHGATRPDRRRSRDERRSACSWLRRSSSSRAACSTSRSGIRGRSASGVRTKRSPGSPSEHFSCTSQSSCQSSVTASARTVLRRRTRRTEPQATGPSRRAVLRGVTAASGLAFVLTAGQTVPLLRKVSVFGVRMGTGRRTFRSTGRRERPAPPGQRATRHSPSRSRPEVASCPSPATTSRSCRSVRTGCRSRASRDGAETPNGPGSRSRTSSHSSDRRPGRLSPYGRCRRAAPFARRSCRATSWTTRERCWPWSSTANH